MNSVSSSAKDPQFSLVKDNFGAYGVAKGATRLVETTFTNARPELYQMRVVQINF
jgi:hypothetical protein